MNELQAGVDLGGTSIKAAVATADGQLIAEDHVPTESHRGPDVVLERIVQLVLELVRRSGHSKDTLSAVGLGVPGLVDLTTGTTKFLPNLPTQWRDIPVASRLAGPLGCQVRLLNDVRTATLGELRFGHGRHRPNATLAFFSIGTGIGGGVAIAGKLRLGPLGAAGELGHQTILPDGPRCGCGNRGCLEALASGPAISAAGIRLMRTGLAPKLHEIAQGNAANVTAQEMAQAASHDDAVREVIVQAATYLGIAAANVVTVLHPDLIILGGGVSQLGDILVETVKNVIAERVGMFPTDQVQVAQSQIGERAGIMGAIALANEDFPS